MSTRYEVDYSEVEKLQEKLSQIPGNIEKLINDNLHSIGVDLTVLGITKRLPMSNRNKRHAKTSKWWKSDHENLGFTIKARGGAANKKGSFGYLVFPNEGRGPSNPLEQRFMEHGMEQSVPKILNDLNEKIDKKIKEEFE